MYAHTFARRLMAGSAFAAFAAFAIAAPAFAQDASALTPNPPVATPETGPNGVAAVDAATSVAQSAQEGSAGNAEIVVTGSILRRTSAETPSPVTVLTQDNLAKAGITNINDAIRSVSADNAGSISTGFQNGFSAGGAATSLRGLGVSSTLVLIDGLRSTNFPLNDDGHNAYVDLNTIPFTAVDRVEVLKDGASSTYGADAIGGVVNIIMKKHFAGLSGQVEGGVSQYGDAGRLRANVTAGYGDYERQGFNIYVNGEYQHDSAVTVKDRSFPFNTLDLSSIGGKDQNNADDTLSVATANAVVRRTTQGLVLQPNGTTVNAGLNDPRQGGLTATGTYTSLNLNCANGTYTVAGAAGGTACRHDNTYEYAQIQPQQERYAFDGRLSFRLSDNVEGYVTGSYAHDEVLVRNSARPIRSVAPTGAPVTSSSNNPGIVLPYFVCSAGVNCITATDRRLNPNNPYATDPNATAAVAQQNAARIYYLFGDLPFGSDRTNQVLRGTAGLNGTFGDGFNWRVEGVAAKSTLTLRQFGYLNIAGLLNAINTCSYNFVNPNLNSTAVRNAVSPDVVTKPKTTLLSLDGSVSKALFELPGGDLQVAIGGQIRRETQNTPNANINLDTYGLNTASAKGSHTVSAGFFEINAPILKQLEIDASGRFDHYSEGFSHFSPKIGAKFTPIPELAVRGTFSKGFRAPTFAESAASQFVGNSNYTPVNPAYLAAHTVNGVVDAYAQTYSVGTYVKGNPDLKPELSRSFTGGFIAQPVRWLSFTADYYNVKKTRVIVNSPEIGAARNAYFNGTAFPDGYSINTIDAIDTQAPTATPRVLIINGIFKNSASLVTSGIDLTATAQAKITPDVKFTSRVEVTDIFEYNLRSTPGAPVQKYVGTMGPYELSSGAGTPKWRGNWQNTIEFGPIALTATTYYVSHIKNVAADEITPTNGTFDLSCANNLYGTGNQFCYIKRFIYADLNASVRVNDAFTFTFNIGNFTNAKAPVAPSSYSGTNYLPTWHYAGIIGRTFRAGANFKF